MNAENKKLLYYHIGDITSKLYGSEIDYETFIIELHDKHYPDAFYFHKPDRIVICTTDTLFTVFSKVEEIVKERSGSLKNFEIRYNLADANSFVLKHPSIKDKWITGEEFYEWHATRYFNLTKIDLRRLKKEEDSEPEYKPDYSHMPDLPF